MDHSFVSFENTERQVTRAGNPAASNDTFVCGDVKLDTRRYRVWLGSTEIILTATGFRILHVLMKKPGVVLSRDALLDAVWGEDTDVCHRTVDTSVKRLRDAFSFHHGNNPIRTVRGIGYAFDETYCSTPE